MKFTYNSSRWVFTKTLPDDLVAHLRAYLWPHVQSRRTLGELQDLLLAYRTPGGDRLLIHQLEPVFTYVARFGTVWPDPYEHQGEIG